MNRIGIMVLGAVLAASLCYGQDSTSAPAQAAPAVIGHGSFPVKITKTLDTSKLKEGDTVEVETAGSFKLPDGTLVPKGSKLTGRVTAAKARSKGDPESLLTLTFNELNIANGKQLTVKGTVQAVFPATNDTDPGIASGQAISHAAGLGPPPTDSKMGVDTESSTKPQLDMDTKAVGVQGMHGLELKDGVLSSKGKNVKLGDGVHMIVRVDILG
jgi:hypothetical protein